MSKLVERINALSRENVFEAIRLLGFDTFEVDADKSTDEINALSPFTEKPLENIEVLEELARLTLTVAAYSPQYEADVESTLDALGQKHIILGGLEIVALSIIALGALHVVVSGGKTSQKDVIIITDKQVKIVKETTYGISISEKLAAILTSLHL